MENDKLKITITCEFGDKKITHEGIMTLDVLKLSRERQTHVPFFISKLVDKLLPNLFSIFDGHNGKV